MRAARHTARGWRLWGLVGLLLAPLGQALADPGAQVFSSVSREVVGVGETFALDVEVVGATSEATIRLEPPAGGAVELVRTEPGEAAGNAVSRRFWLRPVREGVWPVPAPAVEVDGVRLAVPAHEVRVYGDAQAFYRATQSVLPVVAEGREVARIGSAFLVAEDALVTAYHVVVGTDRVRVTLPDGRRVTTAKVWAVDPVRDVAVLHVRPDEMRRAGLTPLPLAPPYERGHPGDPAFTAGWPEGVQQTGVGVRYADLHPVAEETIWVSSNRVRPGDSGGPLLDVQGRVVGVVTSGRTGIAEAGVLVEDVCLTTDPRKALALRARRARPFALRDVLDVHARAGAQAHARVLELATSLTRPTGWRHGERDRYVLALQSVAERAPHDAALQFLLGATLDRVGDAPRALEAYRTALTTDASYFPAAYALGHHYFLRGDYEAAEALFQRTRHGTPYATLSALGLARIYAFELRYAEAEAALRDVLRRDHRFAPALYLLGYCQLALGRTAQAEALADRLDDLDRRWAERLRLHLRQPILHPVALARVPPAALRSP